ncbi:MAG: carboxy terminal-processing peptidase [Bacteroidia bacterium]|nr:carboxy terminal-processing peptidase [Bacteroidia bacterium]MDW8300837.1 carboxy terminal-processing peptidase [Bacteroidia bacterium]
MKIHFFLPRLIYLILLLFWIVNTFVLAQKLKDELLTPQNIQDDLKALKYIIQRYHIQPRKFNDSLSKDIFHKFLTYVTHNEAFFTKKEYEQLAQYQTYLDNELHGEEVKFLPMFLPLFKNKVEQTIQRIEKISQNPFQFTKNQTFEPETDQIRYYLEDEIAIQQFWESKLKYAALLKIAQKVGKQNLSLDKIIQQYESTARQQIKQTEIRKLNNLLKHPIGYDRYMLARYLLSIVLCQDPHSYYLTQSEMENLMQEVADKKASFGLKLAENAQGEVYIEQLVPGGSAWKTNELHKGDILVEIQLAGKERIEVLPYSLQEINELLETENTTLFLTVQKANKTLKTVSLSKSIIKRDEENLVKSFIIEGERRVGYIALPGFYTNYEVEQSKGCANDVAKEILKMKQENIEGLILDLRFNGGGSLIEGVELAGIFIDEGALTIITQKDSKPTILKDMNRGTVYDGKLLVMVNRASASASEMLAAVLQDYNRALIVGTNTFGKATGQRPFPVVAPDKEFKKINLHFAYLSHVKLYRITGKTTQLVGVQPDIEIPDNLSPQNYSEASYDFALPADSIDKKVIFKPLPALPKAKLLAKHKQRMSRPISPINQTLQEVAQNTNKQPKTIPLDLAAFLKWYQQSHEETAKPLPNNAFLSLRNLKANETILAIDEFGRETTQKLINKLNHDAHLAESYQILLDWINE